MGLKRRTRVSAEFNLASMIDVIFLLLLFFMLTSKLVNTNALDLTLPSSKTKTDAASETISISVTKDKKFFLDRRQLEIGSMKGAVEARIKELGKKKDKVTLILNAEKGVPIEDVVAAMDIANQLEMKMILATSEGK